MNFFNSCVQNIKWIKTKKRNFKKNNSSIFLFKVHVHTQPCLGRDSSILLICKKRYFQKGPVAENLSNIYPIHTLKNSPPSPPPKKRQFIMYLDVIRNFFKTFIFIYFYMAICCNPLLDYL